MTEHEYSVVGHSRAHIGRYLGIAAAIIASLLTSAYAFLYQQFKPLTGTGMITVPLFGSLVYLCLHWTFDRWVWRWDVLRKALGLPDIEGTWVCQGERSDDGQGEKDWSAKVTIKQTWEKISIVLASATGTESFSRGASLLKRSDGKFVLMYSYGNNGLFPDDELKPHVGYCEITFASDSTSADGYYFNSKGRFTYGRMILTKQG